MFDMSEYLSIIVTSANVSCLYVCLYSDIIAHLLLFHCILLVGFAPTHILIKRKSKGSM